jgi:hypothetical protein
VGDVCRAPSLVSGALVPAVIEHLEDGNEPGQLRVRVRFLQYDKVPMFETVTSDLLEPLDGTDFAVSAARKGFNNAQMNGSGAGGGRSGMITSAIPGLHGSLTQTEREIYKDCRSTLEALAVVLETDGKLKSEMTFFNALQFSCHTLSSAQSNLPPF